MKCAIRVVKLIDQAGRPDRDTQPGFLVKLARQIIMQRGPAIDTAARRAPQPAAMIGPGIDQKQPVVDEQDTAGGEAGAGHGRDAAWAAHDMQAGVGGRRCNP